MELLQEAEIIRFQGTYDIPDDNLEKLTKHVEKLNKKAAKLKCKPITMEVKETYWTKPPLADLVCRMFKDDAPEDRLTCLQARESGQIDCTDCSVSSKVYKVHKVEITGFAPVLGGWRFAGTLQYMPGDDTSFPSTIIHQVPGLDVDLSKFRTAKVICQHCYVDRIRKETFVIQNVETGELKQVGRTCLKDFLGHRDPHQLAEWGEHLGAFDAYASGLGGFGQTPYYDLKEYLGWVCGQVKRHGWVSSTTAREENKIATAGEAWYMFHTGYRCHPKDRWFPEADDLQEAEQIHTWAQTLLDLPEDKCNDYIHNLRVIIRADAVEDRTKGFAASLWIAYKKALEREAKEKLRSEFKPSVWFGEVGQKVTLKVTCTNIIPFESMYGTTRLHKFIDTDGRIFVWMQSAGSRVSIDEGSTIILQGTIKEHRTWQSDRGDVQETGLTRCKVLEVY